MFVYGEAAKTGKAGRELLTICCKAPSPMGWNKHVLTVTVAWPQDEMLALQRINSYTFLVGYLGFLATWILDTVYYLLHRAGVKATDDGLKTVLRAVSPHYALARSAAVLIHHFVCRIPPTMHLPGQPPCSLDDPSAK